MDSSSANITQLAIPAPPVPQFPDSYDDYRSQRTPLIIDNGSTNLRFGFATSSSPRVGLNTIAKYKERRTNKPLLLFGDGIDGEPGAKNQAKTPWEGDTLLNFDALENALDFAFVNLGIDTGSVEHPVLMTERVSSALHSRALTSELMFELYSAPSLAYCVDGVMSFYHNNLPSSSTTPFMADGIVVSFNTASTSVIPMLNGKGVLSHAKRIPWGASQATDYLLKLIQLKYPNFPTRVTPPQANWMLQTFCEFSPDYPLNLRNLKDPLNLRLSERIIQFPFAQPIVDDKTEEEVARLAEKRKEQGRKLQEIAARSRQEKLEQKENDLQFMLNLKERKESESKREWAETLREEGFDDDEIFDETLKKLEADLKKHKKKEAADGEEMVEDTPTFPLVDVADADLDEEGLKEKRKQKLMKAGWEARVRVRLEKQREKEEKEADEQRETEDRERDLVGWATKLRKDQEAIMTKIKDRTRRKAALSDRKSAAAQARMKNIANLASEDKVPKKRRKTGGEDMFGADDADWAIYRNINTNAQSSDEEDDLQQLQAIEQKLLAHDPTFTVDDTHASLSTKRSALLAAFKPLYEEGDMEGKTRIHLNTERWRVCEAWLSPSMAGVDSAGIGEVVQNILAAFSAEERRRLVSNVFVTGSPSQLPGLIPRLQSTLRPILAPEMTLGIVQAADPVLDAWKGMADFARTEEFHNISVTKAEYEEWGGERIKRWWGGNWNMSS